MELQERTIKVRQMIETVIRRTINPKWRFTLSGQVGVYLEKGLQSLPGVFGMSNIDDERIVDYIVYQLYRSRNFIADGSWQTTWLFSQSAKDKYKKQFLSADGKSGMNYYINQWLDEAELSRGYLTTLIAKPKPNPLKKLIYLEAEEPIKRRFLNTTEGLLLCQQSTTGWSPFSETCGQCDHRLQCEEMTAKQYPELVRFRKEEFYGNQKK